MAVREGAGVMLKLLRIPVSVAVYLIGACFGLVFSLAIGFTLVSVGAAILMGTQIVQHPVGGVVLAGLLFGAVISAIGFFVFFVYQFGQVDFIKEDLATLQRGGRRFSQLNNRLGILGLSLAMLLAFVGFVFGAMVH